MVRQHGDQLVYFACQGVAYMISVGNCQEKEAITCIRQDELLVAVFDCRQLRGDSKRFAAFTLLWDDECIAKKRRPDRAEAEEGAEVRHV